MRVIVNRIEKADKQFYGFTNTPLYVVEKHDCVNDAH